MVCKLYITKKNRMALWGAKFNLNGKVGKISFNKGFKLLEDGKTYAPKFKGAQMIINHNGKSIHIRDREINKEILELILKDVMENPKKYPSYIQVPTSGIMTPRG